MECEVLSGRGRVKLIHEGKELIVPPYPKLMHPPQELPSEAVAELKWDGYNVRTLRFDGEIVSLLRGGRIDEKTAKMIKEFYGDNILRFFEKHPNLILCGEVIGKKTMAGYKNVEFDYLIFDIMDLKKEEEERFLGLHEKLKLISDYGFHYVGNIGIFKDLKTLMEEMKKLPPTSEGIEGVVVKTIDGKNIFKLRYDMHLDIFSDKIVGKDKKIHKRKEDEEIFVHFIQGYPEEELGLKRGISPKEFNKLEGMIESLYSLKSKEEIISKSKEITEYMYSLLLESGDFDEEMQKKLYSEVKRYVGKHVGKAIKKKGEQMQKP